MKPMKVKSTTWKRVSSTCEREIEVGEMEYVPEGDLLLESRQLAEVHEALTAQGWEEIVLGSESDEGSWRVHEYVEAIRYTGEERRHLRTAKVYHGARQREEKYLLVKDTEAFYWGVPNRWQNAWGKYFRTEEEAEDFILDLFKDAEIVQAF